MQKAAQEPHHSLLILESHQLLLLVAEAVEAVVLLEPLLEMVALVVLVAEVLRVHLLLERDLVILVELPIQILQQMVGVMMEGHMVPTLLVEAAVQGLLVVMGIHQTIRVVLAVMD
jgi:hypothetical protein